MEVCKAVSELNECHVTCVNRVRSFIGTCFFAYLHNLCKHWSIGFFVGKNIIFHSIQSLYKGF